MVRLYRHKCFINENGLLFLCEGKKGQIFDKRLCLPVSMKLKVLAEVHGSKASGQFKQEIVVGILLKRYFWPTMAVDFDEYHRARSAIFKMTVRLEKYRHSYGRRGQLHIGIKSSTLTSLDKSVTPNKYVLDVTDAFNHWITLLPLPNKEALTVAIAIFEYWVFVFGPMTTVHSDNGSEFISSVTQELIQLMQTKFHAGCSYHLQSQGIVQRVHRTIAKYLRIFVDKSTTN